LRHADLVATRVFLEIREFFRKIPPVGRQTVLILVAMIRATRGLAGSLRRESAFERSIQAHRTERSTG
jgi:hypothetical protein